MSKAKPPKSPTWSSNVRIRSDEDERRVTDTVTRAAQSLAIEARKRGVPCVLELRLREEGAWRT